MNIDEKTTFRGGAWASAVPLVTFLLVTIILVVAGAPQVEGMILGAMLGISLGMLFSHDMAHYSERVFTLMANRTATVAVVCWLWAGAFSGILRESGLVEAIVWIGWNLGLDGAAFTVATFLSAALFAVSVGTGLGTVMGFTAVMYPAGIVLGAHPGAIMGAIFSGAAFGDNLAPISDTTIVSATTQETDVPGVVISRLKYVLIAAGLSCILFYLVGAGSTKLEPAEAERLLAQNADPKGLPMLIPAAIVFVIAVSGYHFLAALTAGVFSAIALGPVVGVFRLGDVLHVTANGTLEGFVLSGAMGMVPTAILTLLLVTSIGLMAEGGLLDLLLERLERGFAQTVRGAEGVIVAIVSFANLCVSVNTVAMITAGPLVNAMRKRHGIHPYRSANLLDTISCSFPYVLPYAATIPAAAAIQAQVNQSYPFAHVIPWSQEAPYIFYCLLLFPVMIVAIATGYGRKAG